MTLTEKTTICPFLNQTKMTKDEFDEMVSEIWEMHNDFKDRKYAIVQFDSGCPYLLPYEGKDEADIYFDDPDLLFFVPIFIKDGKIRFNGGEKLKNEGFEWAII